MDLLIKISDGSEINRWGKLGRLDQVAKDHLAAKKTVREARP